MSGLARYDGAPAPASHKKPAASDEPDATLAYSGQVTFTRWDDLPGGGGPKPAGTVWDHARSETVVRGGAVVQRVTGWALGRDALARCAYERPLARRPDGKFEPAGGWRARSEKLAVEGLVRLRPVAGGDGPGRSDGGTRAELVANRLDMLPASVRRLLDKAGGEVVSDALLWGDAPGSASGREDVRALAVGPSVVVAVRAQRRREADMRVGPWDLAVWRADRAPAGLEAGAQQRIAGGNQKALEGRWT